MIIELPLKIERFYPAEYSHHCDGTLKVIAVIEDSAVITKILAHLGLPPRALPRVTALFLDLFATP